MKYVIALVMALMSATAALAQAYEIRSGDVLRIEVLEDPSLNQNALVGPDGRIAFPLIGTVAVGGSTIEQVQATLTERLSPNFAAPPNVFVALGSVAQQAPAAAGPVAPALIDVFVIGEAANPGRAQVEPGTTILQFFAQIGGFTNFAATKRIQLRRIDASGTEQVYTINYDAVERGGSLGRATVADGDVFVIPQRRLFE